MERPKDSSPVTVITYEEYLYLLHGQERLMASLDVLNNLSNELFGIVTDLAEHIKKIDKLISEGK